MKLQYFHCQTCQSFSRMIEGYEDECPSCATQTLVPLQLKSIQIPVILINSICKGLSDGSITNKSDILNNIHPSFQMKLQCIFPLLFLYLDIISGNHEVSDLVKEELYLVVHKQVGTYDPINDVIEWR